MADTQESSNVTSAAGGSGSDDIEEMKRRVEKMAQEAALLREMQAQLEETEKQANQDDSDVRSVYVGNVCTNQSLYYSLYYSPLVQVDYSATPEELQVHFQACGAINRITILSDKFTGRPKGYVRQLLSKNDLIKIRKRFAYVEFADQSSVANAMVLNESLFHGRLIQVTAKRTNIFGFNKRGRGRGGFRGRPGRRGGRFSGRGGRGRGGYAPY